MIKTEYLNDGNLIRHYSDEGKMLLQMETGAQYSEAVDVAPCRYTYTETDIPIEGDGEEATEADYIESLESLGVQFDE